MPGIAFLDEELAIELADGNVRVTLVEILNPFQSCDVWEFGCGLRGWRDLSARVLLSRQTFYSSAGENV